MNIQTSHLLEITTDNCEGERLSVCEKYFEEVFWKSILKILFYFVFEILFEKYFILLFSNYFRKVFCTTLGVPDSNPPPVDLKASTLCYRVPTTPQKYVNACESTTNVMLRFGQCLLRRLRRKHAAPNLC